MGWERHHFIIVTHYDEDEIREAHKKAKELFNLDKFPEPVNLVTEVIQSIANKQFTFMIGPDGSKEGWETSDEYDEIRNEFTKYLTDSLLKFAVISMDIDNRRSSVETKSSTTEVNIKTLDVCI